MIYAASGVPMSTLEALPAKFSAQLRSLSKVDIVCDNPGIITDNVDFGQRPQLGRKFCRQGF